MTQSESSADLSFAYQMGSLSLDIVFRTSALWTVLFGVSGSGKSSILRAMAGHLHPQSGRITIGQHVVYSSDPKVFVPAHQRPLRWSAQRAMLFPHRSVRTQIEMGLTGSVDRRDLSGAADEVMRHFRLEGLAAMTPEQLSGGEKQRIGVIRSAAGARGRLLLLDEPFSGLDIGVRDELIDQLRDWMGASPIMSVTHDVAEALRLNAHVVRIAKGKVLEQGPASAVLEFERQYVARALGL